MIHPVYFSLFKGTMNWGLMIHPMRPNSMIVVEQKIPTRLVAPPVSISLTMMPEKSMHDAKICI